MLRILPFLPLIVCAFPNSPPPGTGPATETAPQATTAVAPQDEAHVFATQLLGIAEEISRVYVRPVTRQELLSAALTCLYEEVREPLPERFPAELTKGIGESAAPLDDAAILALLAQARERLGDAEPLRHSNDLRVAVRGMLHCLDPFCALITGDDLRRGVVLEESRNDFGFETSDEGAVVRIKSVVLGGPAQRAGLRPGDVITHRNGKSVREEVEKDATDNWPSLARRLDGPQVEPERQVELKVARPGEKEPRTVNLERESYRPETVLGVRRQDCGAWDYWLEDEQKIAHVRIGALENGLGDELLEVLDQLKEGGLRGLILDLRWSPGGYLTQATRVAGLFIKDGLVCKTRSKDRSGQWTEQEYNAHGVADFLDFPMVVLVNDETSGGSELIAAALQDHGRAIVVGQRTRGKASIQTQEPLPLSNTGMKLTSGSFLRPSGKALHRFPDSKPTDDWGVRPEAGYETPLSADLGRLLRDQWLQLSLRPGTERELLPLDDPENDPQRQAALRALEGVLPKGK